MVTGFNIGRLFCNWKPKLNYSIKMTVNNLDIFKAAKNEYDLVLTKLVNK